MMARYFKMVEIDSKAYTRATGEDLGHYLQSVIPIKDEIFIAIDDELEDEICIYLGSV
jgi:hypothetical protein